MSVAKIAPRRPWLAGLLQVVMPGLGNMYAGRPVRGLVLHILGQCVGFAALLALLWMPGLPTLLIFPLSAIGLTVFLVIDGVRCARAAKPDYQLARYNRWYVYILVAIAVVAVKTILVDQPIRSHVFQAFNTPTAAMVPELLVGDHVIVDKSAYTFSGPERRDLAVYRSSRDGVIYLKRIVGLPGETIEIRNKVVFINGRKLDEPYAHFTEPSRDAQYPGNSLASTLIPPDAYFLLGDNRDNSNDSRFSGPVQSTQLLGKTMLIYVSWDSENRKVRWDRIGRAVK